VLIRLGASRPNHCILNVNPTTDHTIHLTPAIQLSRGSKQRLGVYLSQTVFDRVSRYAFIATIPLSTSWNCGTTRKLSPNFDLVTDS
jgi:hypothetical protein